MLNQRNGRLVYFALALAIVAAVLSAEHPGDPYQQARFLLVTVGPEASLISGAIGENAENFAAP